jgi:hypothetical protein
MVRKPLKRLAKGYPTNLHICLRAQKNRLRFVNNINLNWALVAHNYLLSYSGGRDQEDPGWKPALGK